MFFNLLKKYSSLLPHGDCYLCRESVPAAGPQSALLCVHCRDRLPLLAQSCPICAMPMAHTSKPNNHFAASGQSDPNTDNQDKNQLQQSPKSDNYQTCCGACLKNTPFYHKTVAAFHYEPPINEFVTSLKYHAQRHFVPMLCEYLVAAIRREYSKAELPQAIIAVPLHAKKLRQRGFNQAQLIAANLAQQLGIPMLHQQATRERYTQAQSTLDAKQRQRNLRNAFAVKPLKLTNIAIVDDVVTTGTTANELSKQLLKAGASRVDIWCVARAFSV